MKKALLLLAFSLPLLTLTSCGPTEEEVKEAEGSTFGKKSAEEKWNWLTTTYVVGAKPGTYKVTSVSPDTYNGKKIIRIGWDGNKISDFPITTVLSSIIVFSLIIPLSSSSL